MMKSENINTEEAYLPVAWEHRETVETEIEKNREGKIFFFNKDGQVDDVQGKVVKLEEEKSKGVFVLLDTGVKIRLDRIITLFGKIAAAYDEYDAYASACMNCTGSEED